MRREWAGEAWEPNWEGLGSRKARQNGGILSQESSEPRQGYSSEHEM